MSNYFVPIYSWGDEPNSINGASYATHFYSNEYDLYGFEPDAVGHFELSGELPTENEFKEKYNLKSSAI